MTVLEGPRRKALPEWMPERLDDTEREWFEGVVSARKPGGEPKEWAGQRVELNALTAPQLIARIEAGLAEHAATGKVIPPDEVLATQAHNELRERARDLVAEVLDVLLDPDGLAHELADAFADLADLDAADISERLVVDGRNTDGSWRSVLAATVGERVADSADMGEQVRALLTDRFRDIR